MSLNKALTANQTNRNCSHKHPVYYNVANKNIYWSLSGGVMSTKSEEVRKSAFDNLTKNTEASGVFIPVIAGDMLIQLNGVPFPKDDKWFPPSQPMGKKDETTQKPGRLTHATMALGRNQQGTFVYESRIIHSIPGIFFIHGKKWVVVYKLHRCKGSE